MPWASACASARGRAASYTGPRSGVGAQRRGEPGQVARAGSAETPRQSAGQSASSVCAMARKPASPNGSVSSGSTTESSTSRSTASGWARAYCERQLGAVGDPEQRQRSARRAPRGSPRCPRRSRASCRRRGGRRAAGAAGGRRGGAHRPSRSHLRAADEAAAARAALVEAEDDEAPAQVREVAHDAEHLARRPPRRGRRRDTAAPGRRRARRRAPQPRDAERDGARHAAAAVERHVDGGAADAGVLGARPPLLRGLARVRRAPSRAAPRAVRSASARVMPATVVGRRPGGGMLRTHVSRARRRASGS